MDADTGHPRVWPMGGGTMGALMRAHDWSRTPLGPTGNWPQSLNTAVGIMLTTRHPVFIFWGPEHVCLYNDAYAASLGPEKHPSILGARGPEAWPEAWDVIGPQIGQVMAGGEPTWHEDQLVPITRHGRRDDVYWTYGYSPITDAGAPNGVGGVLVLCTETTPTVVARRTSEERFRALAEASSEVMYRMSPDWSEMRQLSGGGFLSATETANRGWLEDYIHPDDRPRVLATIQDAVRSKSVFALEHRVRLADGTLGWTHSRAVPVLDAGGDITEWFGVASDVTARKRAEEALHHSEERLRRALATETVGVIFFDPAGTIREANAAFLSFSGFTHEDVAAGQLQWQELTPPEHMAASWRAFTELTTTGRATPYEKEYFRKDGSRWWGLFAPRLLADGEAVEFILDITGRKREEHRQTYRLTLTEQLRDLADPHAMIAAATTTLGAFLQAAQAGYGEVDAAQAHVTVHHDWNDGRVPSVAGTWRMDDFGPAFIAEMKRGETIVIPDVRADARTRAPEVVAAYDGIATRSILDVPLVKDGRMVAVLFVHHPEPRAWTPAEVEIVEETCERLWAAVERARAEARLRESEERYRLLFTSIDQGFCTVDVVFDERNRPVDYVFAEVNPAFEAQTDLRDAAGKRMRAMQPEHEEHWFEIYGRIALTGRSERFEHRTAALGRWYAVYAFPVGPARHRVGILLDDITARKQAERDLQLAKEKAEQASLSKSKFLAAASHDLRQPMQSLLLFLDVLKPHVAPKGREALKHLGRGLDAMRDLLESLLDISRLDAGIVEPVLDDFAIQDLVEQTGAAYTPIAAAKGITFEVSACSIVVHSDRTLLGRMVRNLVENALRYTESGRIAIECRPAGDRLRVEVSDTGIGIPPEHLERIWEEFHQVGNPERDRNRGLGLGLAIVQRLSLLLKHPVEVHSTPGRGSVFSIEVPLGRAEARPGATSAPQAAGNGRLAVLVDDDAIVLLGLKATFEAWGYDVLAADTTDRALVLMTSCGRCPDVAIADYRLREGRNGSEAILRVREACGADVPGIILTGETGNEVQRDAAAHGLHIVHKPVTPRQLGEALDRLLMAAGVPPGE
ncbi:PAS domain S-box protein [Azospirillum sp.]|uniref:PAS domain S-box protein n=1 Tax=Azospirillum sp. TaxID=34012 RepID=UPI002D4CADCB|nr:PAS domain S-box protein [Azospirillum sp.]HYD67129.1 PAS domain S-box protein [Azospirillum sp.]